MQDKTSTKETGKEKENPLADMAQEAYRNYEQALHAGLKLQQEAGQWWSNLFDQNVSAEDWRKRYNTVANSLRPATQKRVEEAWEMVDKNTRNGTELIKKAVEASQAATLPDSQTKWLDFWTSSVGAGRANAEAVLQFNSRAMETWIEFVQKSTEAFQTRPQAVA
jgi:hypothetical protein